MFPDRLKELRKKKKITQVQFAKEFNIATGTIAMWETGKRQPDIATCERLAKFFNVSPAYLMGWETKNGEADIVLGTLAIKNANPGMSYEEAEQQAEQIALAGQRPAARRINVYGRIPAGVPLEAITDITDWEEIPDNWPGDYIALQVDGDSMAPKYLTGDVVIIKLQDDCESGQNCAVYVNGYDVTLKKVLKNVDHIILQPINPAYEPKVYDYNDDIKILGVVVELRRKEA